MTGRAPTPISSVPVPLPSVALPRAPGLTDALLAPVGPELPDVVRKDLAERFRTALGRPAQGHHSTSQLTVDAYFLRVPTRAPSTPFRWTARTARRTIGLAALRSGIGGGPPAPADSVGHVMRAMTEDGRHGLGRPGGIEQWLASLPAGGVAVVAAEATGWVAGLSGAVTWDRLGGAEIGPADHWSNAGPGVTIRGRADVRVPVGNGDDGSRTVLLTMAGGRPGPTSRAALGLPALVAAVDRQVPVPARVVGWWPECGRAIVLPVDGALLEATADAVVAAVHTARRASGRAAVGE